MLKRPPTSIPSTTSRICFVVCAAANLSVREGAIDRRRWLLPVRGAAHISSSSHADWKSGKPLTKGCGA